MLESKKVSSRPFVMATFNLVISAAGAGLLSYPFAMKSAGVVLTILLTLAFAVFNAYGLNILARFTGMYYTQLRAQTYEELIGLVLGPKAYRVTVAFLLWNVLGTLTGFLIIIGDLGSAPLQHAFNCDGEFQCSRGFVILMVCVVFVLPLSMLRDFHSLWFSSFIGVAGVVVVSGAIIARGAQAGFDSAQLSLFDGDISIVYSINIIIFALGCQLQVVPQVSDLIRFHTAEAAVAAGHQQAAATPQAAADGSQAVPVADEPALDGGSVVDRTVVDAVVSKFAKVVYFTVVFCSILYNLTGLFGYCQFYSNTNGDVLTNFELTDGLMSAAKIVMALHVTLAFPVNIFPGRKALDFLLFGGKGDADHVGGGAHNGRVMTPLAGNTVTNGADGAPQTPQQQQTITTADGQQIVVSVSATSRATGDVSTPLTSRSGRATDRFDEPLLPSATATPTHGGADADDDALSGRSSLTVNKSGGTKQLHGTPPPLPAAGAIAASETVRSSHGGHGHGDGPLCVGSKTTFLQSLGFTVFTGLIATFFPKVQVVFALIGASSSCILTYTMPGYMDAVAGHNGVDQRDRFWMNASRAFWVFGVVLSIFSTIVIVDQSFF